MVRGFCVRDMSLTRGSARGRVGAALGFVAHLLFSPWLLVAAVAILAWVKFRPRHSRQ